MPSKTKSESARDPDAARYAPAQLVEPEVPTTQPVNPATAGALNLDQLLLWADQNAPSIRAAQARVGLADAAVAEAEIFFPENPEVSVGAGPRTVAGSTGFDFEVAIQQQLEIAGESGLRRDVADAERREAKAVVNEVRWMVHVEVHRLFFEILIAAERLDQSERFVEFANSLLAMAKRQVAAGDVSPLELLVAEADTARTQEALIQATQLHAALRTRLRAVIGWPIAALPPLNGTLPRVRRVSESADLLARMAKHHPSIRTRELAVAARRARLALERRDAWPEPTVGVSYSRESAPSPEPGANVWMFNIAMPIPMWRNNQVGKARARAELLVADSERSQEVARLTGDLEQNVIALNADAERVQLYETTVLPRLEKNLALLRRAFELGEVNVHQVSQTQQRLLSGMSQYLDARADYYERRAALESLLGTEIWPNERGSE